MHARYYTFNLGRFMSVDPVGGEIGSSQSCNRYAYVRGNPVNAMDPDGQAGKEVADWIDRKVTGVVGFVDANTGGGAAAILLNTMVGTVGDMVSGAADMLRVGDSTGEAIGEGKSGEDLFLAACKDAGRAGELTLTILAVAVPASRVFKASGSEASSGGLGNPFKNKDATEVHEMFQKKGFETRGPDPQGGKGGYVNPKTGRSYHIDPGGSYRGGFEKPHVDVNRPKGSSLPKKKLPIRDDDLSGALNEQ
jgi:uncharacterized protein RhaS with RHS repeats